MATLAQKYALSTDGTFQRRVSAHALSIALVVIAESPTTDNHTERLALALRVLDDPDRYGVRVGRAVAADDTAADAYAASGPDGVTDAMITSAANAVLTSYALAGV